jgi:hypothetical protein
MLYKPVRIYQRPVLGICDGNEYLRTFLLILNSLMNWAWRSNTSIGPSLCASSETNGRYDPRSIVSTIQGIWSAAETAVSDVYFPGAIRPNERMYSNPEPEDRVFIFK